jgi:hypothetical protein
MELHQEPLTGSGCNITYRSEPYGVCCGQKTLRTSMANYASKFTTSDNTFTGGYTSLEVLGNYNDDSKIGRGVVQIHITTGTVDLQAKLTEGAPWTTIKNYTASTIEEVVIAPYFRVIASDSAECFYAEHS